MTGEDALNGSTVAGRYEIIRKLGAGGMGAVYLARQISMDRMVALKLIHPQSAGSDAAVQRFHREMKTTSQIEHPNTIRVYDFGQTDDGQLFLAMELLEGRTLTELLRASGALPPIRARAIAAQIARALSAAHEKQIVHRDLKPDNVMVLDLPDHPDFVKVLDFGIARFLGDEAANVTTEGAIIGTPNYMSPEQGRGEKVDPRSDLYSLGVMLYQMSTGRVPWSGPMMNVIVSHSTEQPIAPSLVAPATVDAPLEAIILHLLKKTPAERPQSALALVAELEAKSDVGHVPPTRIGAPAPRNSSWLFLGGVVAFAAVAVGIAVPLLLRARTSQARVKLDQLFAGDGDPAAPLACRTRDEATLELLCHASTIVKSSPGEALALLEKATAEAPQSAEYWALVARARLGADHPAEALVASQQAAALCPDFALAHDLAGNADQKLRKLPDAETAYRKAIADAPSYQAPRFNLGLLALRRNDTDAAIREFDKVLQLDPNHPNAYFMRGQAHLAAGHAAEAIADLAENARRKPNEADGWFLLGMAHHANHDEAGATEAFCKAKGLGNADAGKMCP